MPRVGIFVVLLLLTLSAGEADARRKGKGGEVLPPDSDNPRREQRAEKKAEKAAAAAAAAKTAAPAPSPSAASSGVTGLGMLHYALAIFHAAILLLCIRESNADDKQRAFRRSSAAIAVMFLVEAAAHTLAPLPHFSVGVMVLVSVVFTISPVEDSTRPLSLHMGSVPPLCVLWLCATGIMSYSDLVTALYGSESLRPYHLIVMFLGSVYLCTALERSGFLHTAALKVGVRCS